MKNLNRIAAFALAGLMTFTMATPAMADTTATTYSITIEDSTSGNVKTSQHTMKAYQIFTGDLNEVSETKDGETTVTRTLSNIQWGTGFDPAELLAALKADATLGTDADLQKITYNTDDPSDSAQKLADIIANYNASETKALNAVLAGLVADETKTANSCANNNGTNQITGLTAGYYFINDEGSSDTDGSDASSDYILQVLANESITIKTDAPTVTKKIRDGENLVDTSSASIGEKVPYHISADIPDTSAYDTSYYYYMTDTFSAGLTFNDDVVAYIDMNDNDAYDTGDVLLSGTNVAKTTSDKDFYVYSSANATDSTATDIQIAFTKVLSYGQNTEYAGKDICVDYTGTINSNAVVGVAGNPNKVDLTYSNKPSYDYDFSKTQDTDKPGLPDSEEIDSDVTGTTPKDIVKTYVTELDMTKWANTAEGGNELEGAEFTLTGTATRTVVKSETVYTEDLNGTWYLLKDGTYTQTAPTTSDITTMRALTAAEKATATKGYVKAADTDATATTDVTIDSVRYRVVNDNETPDYILSTKTATDSKYASTTAYSQKTVETTATETYSVNKVFVTGADGKISFTGLDAGTYTLKETVTPAGYNTCDDIVFTIECGLPTSISSGDETCTWTIKDVTGATVSDFKDANQVGYYAIDIIDKSGAVLPTTGGMGTTIFYVLGAILVLGAGVVLVSRRRAQ